MLRAAALVTWSLTRDESGPGGGVSLATVTDTYRGGTRERLLWVVYVDDVTAHCFGGSGCGLRNGDRGPLIDPRTLQTVESTVF